MSSPHVSQYSSNSLSSCTKQWLALFTGFRSVGVALSGVTGTFSSLLAESSRISRCGMLTGDLSLPWLEWVWPVDRLDKWGRVVPAGLGLPVAPGIDDRRHGSTGVFWGQCRCPDKINEHSFNNFQILDLLFSRACADYLWRGDVTIIRKQP